jgi:acetyl-CoA carboxylase biotin carboxyl carrier protein
MNQKELKELIEFLIEKDIAEFELERGDVKVKIKRGADLARALAGFALLRGASAPVDSPAVPASRPPGRARRSIWQQLRLRPEPEKACTL